MSHTAQYNVNNWVQEFSEYVRNKQTMDERIKGIIINAVVEFDAKHRHSFRDEVVEKAKGVGARRPRGKGAPPTPVKNGDS